MSRTNQQSDQENRDVTSEMIELTSRLRHSAIASVVVIGLHQTYRYKEHWWWDNLAHFTAGYAIGSTLSEMTDDRSTVLQAFLAITTGWEIFEYSIDERPWDGSMTWDHAMEDTVLDTYMGLTGAYVATLVH